MTAPSKEQSVDLLWRSLWTGIAFALGGVPVGAALYVDTLVAMAMAGGGAVATVVLVFARQQLGTVQS